MYQVHKYGPQVKIINDLFLNSLLTKLCSPNTVQPQANQLIELLYAGMLGTVVSDGFFSQQVKVSTRMTNIHKDQFYEGPVIDPNCPIVVANLARAGTIPSYVIYQMLNQVLPHQKVRQDHIMATRETDTNGRAIGANFGAAKIGGSIENSIVLFPDPMGATGGTIAAAVEHYTKKVHGPARKFMALHLIVTPEHLRKITTQHPDMSI